MSSKLSQEPDRRVCVVSACLLGLPTRYDGKSKPRVVPLDGYTVIPVCPEQLGGLPTPRPSNMLTGGDGNSVLAGISVVLDKEGRDVTREFLTGAKETLKIAQAAGATVAFLKSKSPSCGYGSVWVDGVLTCGSGVAAALLAQNGIDCIEVD